MGNAWPETDRQYAFFAAHGAGEVDAITRALGVDPNDCWNAGDRFERDGRSGTRFQSFWRLNSGATDQERLSDHIEKLLWILESRRKALKTVQTTFATTFHCVSFSYQSFGWDIEIDLQRRASVLAITFDFEFYPFSDLRDEFTDLEELMRRTCHIPDGSMAVS